LIYRKLRALVVVLLAALAVAPIDSIPQTKAKFLDPQEIVEEIVEETSA
jgi:hypothetical protein